MSSTIPKTAYGTVAMNMNGTHNIVHREDGKLEIRTERLLLRAMRDSDIQSLHRAFIDPEVMQFWSTLPHESIKQTEDWVRGMIRNDKRNGVVDFAICLRSADDGDSPAVGKIGSYSGFEIGFILPRMLWGKGYGSEALSAVINYLFDDVEGPSRSLQGKGRGEDGDGGDDLRGFEKLYADVEPKNAASLALLKKFGFVQIGPIREKSYLRGDTWDDTADLELTREEWSQQQQVKVVK